jgi:hypothetical protein
MRADLGSVDPAQFGRKTLEPNRYACTKDVFYPIIEPAGSLAELAPRRKAQKWAAASAAWSGRATAQFQQEMGRTQVRQEKGGQG